MFGLGQNNTYVTAGGLQTPLDGIRSFEDWNAFVKAVQTSGYETNHAALTGSQALRMESLEPQLVKVIEQEDSFKLFKGLERTPVTSSVHEFSVQTGIGGQLGGMFNTETGVINADMGSYERRIVFVKYLMTRAVISHVASLQKGIVNLKAAENQNALLRLARAANYVGYHGDEAVSPEQFNGIYAQLKRFEGGSHIRSLDGSSDVGELMDGVFTAFATVMGQGNFGKLTHMMLDPLTQNALDRHLDPAFRVALADNPSAVNVGAPVRAIRTSYGDVVTETDIFIENGDNTAPAFVRNRGGVPESAPQAPTVTATALTGVAGSGVAGSKFSTGRGGTYFYVVAARDNRGVEGVPSDPVSVAVAEGGAAQLTITPHTSLKHTGYAIYRSKQNPDAAPHLRDYRLVERIPANAVRMDPTVYVDDNDLLPGRSTQFLLNRVPESIDWVQLMPATQWPLYATDSAIIPWAVLLYITLAVRVPNHHYILENFIPPQQSWKPHSA